MEQITCANASVGISTAGHYEELEQPFRTMWVNLQSVNPALNLPLLLGFKFLSLEGCGETGLDLCKLFTFKLAI